jgi:hypothetical protein
MSQREKQNNGARKAELIEHSPTSLLRKAQRVAKKVVVGAVGTVLLSFSLNAMATDMVVKNNAVVVPTKHSDVTKTKNSNSNGSTDSKRPTDFGLRNDSGLNNELEPPWCRLRHYHLPGCPTTQQDVYFAAPFMGNGNSSYVTILKDGNTILNNLNSPNNMPVTTITTLPNSSAWVIGQQGSTYSVGVVWVPSFDTVFTTSVRVAPDAISALSPENVCIAAEKTSEEPNVGMINTISQTGSYVTVPGTVNSVTANSNGDCYVSTSLVTADVSLVNGVATIVNSITTPSAYVIFDSNNKAWIGEQGALEVRDTSLDNPVLINLGGTSFPGNVDFLNGKAYVVQQLGNNTSQISAIDQTTYATVNTAPFGANGSSVVSALRVDKESGTVYGIMITPNGGGTWLFSLAKIDPTTLDTIFTIPFVGVGQGMTAVGMNAVYTGDSVASNGATTPYVYIVGGPVNSPNDGLSIFEFNPTTRQLDEFLEGFPIKIDNNIPVAPGTAAVPI